MSRRREPGRPRWLRRAAARAGALAGRAGASVRSLAKRARRALAWSAGDPGRLERAAARTRARLRRLPGRTGEIVAAGAVAATLVLVLALALDSRDDVPLHLPTPDYIRGVYVPAAAAADDARLAELVALVEDTEINTLVVDVKDERGVRYASDVPLAAELAGDDVVYQARRLTRRLHRHGAYLIARLVVFHDPKLARARPEWAIREEDGTVTEWVSPYDTAVWAYHIALAEEAVAAGFDEVQLDYVRFPTDDRQVHPVRDEARSDAIRGFVSRARTRLDALGAPLGVDVFGWSMHDPGDVGIGQSWERLLRSADRISPMVYPSHYPRRDGRPHPNNRPAETVRWSLGHGVARARMLRAEGLRTARIVPWLQGFSAPWVDPDYRYGPKVTRWQKEAVYAVGLEDWVLWHPRGDYGFVRGGFDVAAVSRARPFDPPRGLLREGRRYAAGRAQALEDYLAERRERR